MGCVWQPPINEHDDDDDDDRLTYRYFERVLLRVIRNVLLVLKAIFTDEIAVVLQFSFSSK